MANLVLWSCVNLDFAPIRPGGPYQIASWLRAHGYTVKVIDFCHLMTVDELVEITLKHVGPDTLAIGVTSSFWYDKQPAHSARSEPDWVVNARLLIDSKINIRWLLGGGGSQASNLKFGWIKFDGYAEDGLLKWVDENSNRYVRRQLFDIKTLEKKFVDDDLIRPEEVIPIELGRGCQFKCRFCSYPLIGKKPGTYIREYHLIKDEILRNYDNYGTTKYYFLDDTVNESEEKIQALADIAQSLPFKLEWVGYNRLDLIWSKPSMIQTLKDSGLRSAYFGIESFHPKASMAVGKGWNGRHGKDFLLKLKDEWKEEISFHLSFIIGLPGETRDSIEESYKWCIDNKMYDWVFHPLVIFEHKAWKSEFELNYEKYGYKLNYNFSWKNEHWTQGEAGVYSRQLLDRKLKSGITRPAAWYLAMLSSLCYTFDELMETPSTELDSKFNFAERRDKIMRDYVNHNLDK